MYSGSDGVMPADTTGPTLNSQHPTTLTALQVPAADERGRRQAAEPTLFFMPHCEQRLTEALLGANLAAGTLHHAVLLGNRFSGYLEQLQPLQHQQQQLQSRQQPQQQHCLERPPSQQQQQQRWDAGDGGGAMARLVECGAVLEASVDECGFPVPSAFNDLGLHCFPTDWRQRLAPAPAGGPADCPLVSAVK